MNESLLETLLVRLALDDKQYEAGLAGAVRQGQGSAEKIKTSFAGIGDSVRSLGSLPGLVGAGGLIFGLRNAATETAKAEAASRVFERTLARSNASESEAARITQSLADRFGLLRSDVEGAAGILLRANLPLEIIEQTLLSAGASAVQTGFDVSTAFQNIAVGVSQGRSEVVESSGILANASTAWQTYADSVGKSVGQLSDQEKALAFANAIIEETRLEVEDLDTAYGGLFVSQNASNQQWREIRTTVGGLVGEALIPLNEETAKALGFINGLPTPLKTSATAFFLGSAGATALATGLGTLALVLGPLTGTAGLLILAAGGVAAIVAASKRVPESVNLANDATKNLTSTYDGLKNAVEGASEAEREAARQRAQIAITEGTQALNRVRSDLSGQLRTTRAGLQAAGGTPGNPIFEETVANARPVQLLREEAERLETQLSKTYEVYKELLDSAPAVAPGGLPTDPSFSPSGSEERTLKNIFDEVGEAGTRANERAVLLGNTLEERLGAAETRADLLSGALDEIQERPDATPAVLDNIVERLQSATAEAESLKALLDGDLGTGAVLGQLGGDRTAYNPGPDSSALNARTQIFAEGSERQAQAARERADKDRIYADTAAAQAAAVRTQATETFGELGGLLQQGGGAVAAYANGLVGIFDQTLDRVEQGVTRTDAILARLGSDTGSYTPAPDSSGTNQRLYDQQDYIAGLLGLPVNRGYTEAPNSSANPLLPSRGGSNALEVDASPFELASQNFLNTLPGIFESGASNFASAILSGQGAAAAGGGFFGDLLGAGLGLGGIALGVPPQISGILGGFVGDLLGGLLGGAFGGDSDSDARSRASRDLERRGGAASVNFTAMLTQNNSFQGGIAEPSTEAALNRQTRRIFAELLAQTDFSRISKKATS